MKEREFKRKSIQDALDEQKSQKERNVMGQFSTPYLLAQDIMRYMRNLIGKDDVSLIEPAIGMGVFYSAFIDAFSAGGRALGFEIDPHYFKPASEFWKGTKLEMRCADFLAQKADEQFDMLVANPPYIRHHYIETQTKKRLQHEVMSQTGIKISGLAGLYCYFMMLSAQWLKDGGLSCWLVPSEFMDVNYGVAVKRYLLQNVELLHIHRFKADDLQFADALVSSCIVVFRKSVPPSCHEVKFTIGGTINNPETIRTIKANQLRAEDKWTNLFNHGPIQTEAEATLGDFFTVKRGVATGDNGFFVIDNETIDRYEIPKNFLRPILPSPRYIKGDHIESRNGLPVVDQQLFLFCCNLPEERMKKLYPKVWEYVMCGYERGVQRGYICSRRNPWYSCEEREPAPFVVPYMGREEASNRLFRFILNDSNAITTNVYLLLYPKAQYAQCLKDKAILTEVWHVLNTIPTETLSSNGRFYGGGLRKMEPKELMQTPATGIASLLTHRASFKQLTLFE